MAKVFNEFNRVAGIVKYGDKEGGAFGAANKVPDPRGLQELNQKADGLKLHKAAIEPKDPEPSP